MNIEIKSLRAADAVREVIDFYVAEGWSRREFMVSSFKHEELHRFSAISPDVKIGVLTEDDPFKCIKYAETIGAYSINAILGTVSPAFVASAHAKGIRVFVWTVNEPEEISALDKMEVDGIITDFPGRANEFLTQGEI
jgi:glycerophosphoryl diester phosphodiesterase